MCCGAVLESWRSAPTRARRCDTERYYAFVNLIINVNQFRLYTKGTLDTWLYHLYLQKDALHDVDTGCLCRGTPVFQLRNNELGYWSFSVNKHHYLYNTSMTFKPSRTHWVNARWYDALTRTVARAIPLSVEILNTLLCPANAQCRHKNIHCCGRGSLLVKDHVRESKTCAFNSWQPMEMKRMKCASVWCVCV